MAKRGSQDEERLLERLREAVSGDQSMRRLRRRYDSLRRDYEVLLDRLADIEQRMELSEVEDAPEPAARTRPVPGFAPQHASSPGPGSSLGESLLAPLVNLREEYLVAASNIQAIVGGLEDLAAGAMKGQRPAGPARAESQPQPSAPPERPEAETEGRGERPRSVQVDIKGHGFGALLDFQERLSEIEGVARVSINAIDHERATLVVELEPEDER
jgi:hypothetical protein